MKDMHNNVKVSSAIPPAAIITGNATKTSSIIDMDGYGSIEFAVHAGALTDGTYTTTLYAGDSSDMSDEVAVTTAALGLLGTAPVHAATDDNVVKKVGYKGSKRYLRIKTVQSGATTGGFISALAIQGRAKAAPVS